MSDSAANLTGVWHGQYSYDDGREPVAFIATLSDVGGAIAGSTEETVPIADAPATLRAALQGRREGRALTMLKLYDGSRASSPGRVYDFVHYAGDVAPDGLEIEGRWRVQQSSGRFLMLRAGDAPAQTAAKATERA